VQSVPITTKVVSSNPVHGEVYSMHHYVIKLSAINQPFYESALYLIVYTFSCEKSRDFSDEDEDNSTCISY